MNSEQAIKLFERDLSGKFSEEVLLQRIRIIKRFFLFCPKEIDEICKQDIVTWLHTFKNSRNAGTINIFVRTLFLLFECCVDEGIINKNPANGIKTPMRKYREISYLEMSELLELRSIVKLQMDRAIIDCLYYTGVRVSELINIQKEDVDFEEQTIWIRQGKGLKQRFVYFTPDCCEQLLKYLDSRKDDSPFLFVSRNGKPLNRRKVIYLINKYNPKTTITKSLHPHIFRHTLAVHLSENGAPLDFIGDLLGHRNYETTRRYYAHLTDKASKEEYDFYF